MHLFLHHFLPALAVAFGGVFVLSLILTFLGRSFGGLATRAPGLDLIVALMTWVPWVVCVWLFGWIGLPAAILGQMIALFCWCWIHEAMHPAARKGPRIVKFINRTVGRWQNHVALWVTLVALPAFLWFATRTFASMRTALNDIYDVSIGLRWRFLEQGIVSANVVVPLNRQGLQAAAVPTLDVEYAF